MAASVSSSACFIGAIDQGTTSTRFILYDQQAVAVASHQMEFSQIHPRVGWVEHDPHEILQTVRECMQGALAQVEPTEEGRRELVGRIRAVGLTNQRETSVVWRRSTGQALYNAIVWMDVRTAELCERLQQQLPNGRLSLHSATGLPLSTYFSALKLKWLLENEEEVRRAVEEGDALFGTIDSWLVWNLTDGAAHVTDCTNASRTLLMNLSTLDWDEDILHQLAIPRSILPSIVSNAEILGTISSSWPLGGVPLAGCLGDQHAALLGQRCGEFEAKATFGTGCFILLNTGSKICLSSHGLLSTVGFKLGRESTVRYAMEGSIGIAGAAVQWLRDSLGIISSASEIEGLARTVSSSGGVFFVPAFNGLYAPRWREDARGVIVGISRYTSKAHIARAVLDAMAFQTREVIEAMAADVRGEQQRGKQQRGEQKVQGVEAEAKSGREEDVTTESLKTSAAAGNASTAGSGSDLGAVAGQGGLALHIDGGASANQLLAETLADTLGCPVLRPADIETTARGAAFAAGIAVGLWGEEEVLGGKLGGVDGEIRFEPRMDEVERDRRFRSWNKAVLRSYDLADLV